jgi:biopolymer transport protein ExbB
MGEFFAAGGYPMYLILACSVAALAVAIERAVRIERARVELPTLLRPVSGFAREGRWEEALRHCGRMEKPAARVARSGLEKRGRPRAEVREALEDSAERELVGLERRLEVLSVIAHVTPLIGLLGTVVGMIEAFIAIESQGGGPVDQSVLSGGIWKALLTTAAGLTVAIPVYVVYRVLQARVARHAEDFERAAADVLEMVAAPGEGA